MREEMGRSEWIEEEHQPEDEEQKQVGGSIHSLLIIPGKAQDLK